MKGGYGELGCSTAILGFSTADSGHLYRRAVYRGDVRPGRRCRYAD
jgi:hypothetical protein